MTPYPETPCPTCGTLVNGRSDAPDGFPEDSNMVECPKCGHLGYLEVTEDSTTVVFITI